METLTNYCITKRMTMAVLLVCMPLCYMNGQVKDENVRYYAKEVTIIDTLEAERMANEARDSVRAHIERLNGIDAELTKMIANAGGKVKSQEQQLLLLEAFHKVRDVPEQKKKEGIGKQYLNNLKKSVWGGQGSSTDDSQRENMWKQIQKGKISKDFVPYLEMYKETIIASGIINAQDSLDKGWEELIGRESLPRKTVMVDTPNPYYRPYAYNNRAILDTLDKKYQTQGWEWLDNEDAVNQVEKYPDNITFKKYESHLEYRIVGNYVYDGSGNLVRVITCLRKVSDNDFIKTAKRFVFAKDYKNNKYNIASASKDTRYSLENRLGLSDEAKKKAGKNADKLVNSMVDAYTAKTMTQQRKARDQGADAMMGMTFGYFMDLYDEKANRYIEQLDEDHKHDFEYVYRIDRIDNNNFKLLFLDSSGKATYTFKITYINDGKYQAKYDISMIDTAPFSLELDKNVTDTEEDDDDSTLVVPDEPADFHGDVYAWLANNIRYPAICQENGVQGRVYVQFIVNRDGSITDVTVQRSPDENLSKEAERVIKSMPKWKPAYKDGKPVRSSCTLPIMFRL